MTKIDQPIVGYQVLKNEPDEAPASIAPGPLPAPAPLAPPAITEMHEGLARPEMLTGSTYKIKAPVLAHAMYITINDIVLNPGTTHEERRPFEIFVNSKNMEQFQWIVALTRVMSAVFRKGGDVAFLVEELKAVFDPNGGYYKSGGVFMPSLVAEIGSIVERHLKTIGVITNHLDPGQVDLIAKKRAELSSKSSPPVAPPPAVSPSPVSPVATASFPAPREPSEQPGDFPPGAELCKKCFSKAVIIMDGCRTCLNCGDSKCG